MLDEEHRLITGEAQFDSPIFRIHKKILSEQKFKVLICNSNMMHDYFKDKYCIDEKRMRVLYPGYDSEIFNTSDIDTCRQLVRKRHGIDRKYVLGFISSGNLVKRGVDILINAMGMLDSGLSKETALLIVGKDDKTDDYKRRIAEVNPDLQIIGAGAVDDIVNYYKTIDILLHPAHIEEFGMTLLEAAACGVPVVTSKKTGFSEVLRGEERDFVMEKPEPTALAEMTTRLLNDDETRKRIGASSAVNATGYSWDKYFSRLYEIYSDFSLLP
jgi:UDP-glucose:(heptosyl)LPS alpha-1,3-glucosyltransferase